MTIEAQNILEVALEGDKYYSTDDGILTMGGYR
jgi:hypothetical protein